MDSLVVVTHPQPVRLEARHIEHEATPPGSMALAYYHDERLVARSRENHKGFRSLLHDVVQSRVFLCK